MHKYLRCERLSHERGGHLPQQTEHCPFLLVSGRVEVTKPNRFPRQQTELSDYIEILMEPEGQYELQVCVNSCLSCFPNL